MDMKPGLHIHAWSPRSRRQSWVFVAATLLTWHFIAAGVSTALEVPPLQGRVNDLVGILSSTDKTRLEQQLSAIESETTNQIAILIIPSLDGNPIEDFSIRVSRTWALGRKGRNNGVLILMSVLEREARIEVGYGLEGALTDAQSSYIIRNIMVPEFRQQHYANGLSRAVDAIAAAIAGEFRPESRSPVSDSGPDPFTALFLSVLLMAMIPSFIRSFQPVTSGLAGAGLGLLNSLWLFSAASFWLYLLCAFIGSAAAILFYYMNMGSFSRGLRRGPTVWSGGSRGIDLGGTGGWRGLGGDGFTGGGGSFGGGGASGRW